jgi:poly(hydroxyalkanoate) depolymerase family esterase
MYPDFQRLMQDATRLVRGGDLKAATAAIQSALNGADHMRAAEPNPAAGPGKLVIDVEAREVGTPAAAQQAPEAADMAGAGAGEGTFLSGRSGDARAQRDYRLYVPPQSFRGPRPLIVMLHGCTQDPDDFADGTRMNELARRHGCFVLYPAQTQQANPQRCWNWFKHSHQERGRGEPALLSAMTRHVMGRHDIDAARVYVAGLSAGGAMAAILAATYPDLYAAVGVHSGLAAGAAKDLPSALAAMRSGAHGTPSQAAVPAIVFHGDADATVHPGNGHDVVRASMGAVASEGHEERLQSAGGRSYTRRVHRSPDGAVLAEHWVVHGGGHAWSGGSRDGSYTDPAGPDASQEMLRFFLQHPRPGAAT